MKPRMLLALLLASSSLGVSANGQQDVASQHQYLEFATAYLPLSECVHAWLESGQVDQQLIPGLISQQSDFSVFESEAMKILGADNAISGVEHDSSMDPATRARGLMAGLGAYAAVISNQDSFAVRINRQRAVALVIIKIAEVSGGRCKSSKNLNYWMNKTRHANI